MKPLPPLSDGFRETAIAEREELIRRYHDVRRCADELEASALTTAADADRYVQAAREIGELLGLEDQLSIVELGGELRGQRLRDIAVAVLWRHFKDGDVVHYREWLELVVAEGHRIGGKNPNATFLTQIARVETVERIGRRTGLYKLRAVA